MRPWSFSSSLCPITPLGAAVEWRPLLPADHPPHASLYPFSKMWTQPPP